MLKAARFIAVFLISLLWYCFVAAYKPAPDVVRTNAGPVSGTVNKEGNVRIFRGIPFAAPPLGDLRWKAPQPVASWKEVKACHSFGPSPMQAPPVPFSMWSEEFLIPKHPISEDCLYLNVWTGAQSEKEKRPVLVWIYGGGFASGGAAVPIYDGEAMAKKRIVFVSINYRVGIFGFFAHPELTKESGKNASGNYCLMDQIAALKWVHENIKAFGGDPDNVTIAGQSAGSMSVNCMVASPLAKGYFKKAIAQSGANFLSGVMRSNTSLSQAEAEGERIARSLNASSLKDLRNIPAEELMKKAQGIRGPIIDGYVLPQSIAQIFASNKENRIDLMTGWNEDEGILFGPKKNAVDFSKELTQTYGPEATKMLKYYPASSDEEAATSQLQLSRDMIFGVQNYTWANVQSTHGSNVYVYRFTRKVPGTGEYAHYGAFHTGEVPYAYDNLKFVNRPFEPIDHELAAKMSAYWVNFITSGNPNGRMLPNWPKYSVNDQRVVLLGDKVESVSMPGKDALDFLYDYMSKK